jgi:hypothetical protein
MPRKLGDPEAIYQLARAYDDLDRLARAFGRLPDGPMRRAIVQMVLALAASGNARSRGRVEAREDSVE